MVSIAIPFIASPYNVHYGFCLFTFAVGAIELDWDPAIKTYDIEV